MNKGDIVGILMEEANTDKANGNGNANNTPSNTIASLIIGVAAFIVGNKYFIRTVTHHFTGRLKYECMYLGVGFLVFEDAAWIASDGRFTQAVDDGVLEEVEPVKGLVRINVSSIIDAHDWVHPLPRTQK